MAPGDRTAQEILDASLALFDQAAELLRKEGLREDPQGHWVHDPAIARAANIAHVASAGFRGAAVLLFQEADTATDRREQELLRLLNDPPAEVVDAVRKRDTDGP